MYVGHDPHNGYTNPHSHSQHSPMHSHSHSQNGSSHPSTRHNSTSSAMGNIPPPSMMMSSLPPPGPPALPNAVQMAEGYGRGEDRRIYELVVYQQPIRARMCGFGDKDRRPITPPPCARLIVRDLDTGKEIDINEIDTSFFVLTVDLWSADGNREVNLVRHSATSPSISAAVSSSYPPPPATPPPHQQHPQHSQHQQYPSHQYPPSHQSHQQQPPHAYPPSQQYPSQGYPPYGSSHSSSQPQSGYYSAPPPLPSYGNSYLPPPPPMVQQGLAPSQQQGSGMFTRNLIGSLSASAFKLTDPDHKLGVWFILQDLSVRTEGTFKLKLNFVNVGFNGRLNTGNTPVPVMATAFSSQFQVYSAKKFPGVIESTDLSKCFATQGIKIPIRKDGPKALSRGQDYDDDD